MIDDLRNMRDFGVPAAIVDAVLEQEGLDPVTTVASCTLVDQPRGLAIDVPEAVVREAAHAWHDPVEGAAALHALRGRRSLHAHG